MSFRLGKSKIFPDNFYYSTEKKLYKNRGKEKFQTQTSRLKMRIFD